jgi:hypothetical protein
MSYYYTRQGYALIEDAAGSEHHFGGDAYHDGAICPVCQIPLLLLADFDCVSLRALENKKLFSELARLPLYYCWRCCAEELSYRLTGPSTIKVFKNEGKPEGDDFPYEGFPERFSKRPIKLVPIPYETAKLLAVAEETGVYWLTEGDRKAIQDGLENLRHPWFSKSSFSRHQVGGIFNLAQGHEYVVCPNPACEYHQSAKRHIGTRMMELAVIHNDPHAGLPMCERLEELTKPTDFNEFTQVIYWVCEKCLTITTSNRCE